MTRPANTPIPRSDTDIFAEARKALDDQASIPAGVRIHVEAGTAWLTGTARLASQRAAAEAVVGGVAGVQRVVNKIVVAEPAPEEELEHPDRSL